MRYNLDIDPMKYSGYLSDLLQNKGIPDFYG